MQESLDRFKKVARDCAHVIGARLAIDTNMPNFQDLSRSAEARFQAMQQSLLEQQELSKKALTELPTTLHESYKSLLEKAVAESANIGEALKSAPQKIKANMTPKNIAKAGVGAKLLTPLAKIAMIATVDFFDSYAEHRSKIGQTQDTPPDFSEDDLAKLSKLSIIRKEFKSRDQRISDISKSWEVETKKAVAEIQKAELSKHAISAFDDPLSLISGTIARAAVKVGQKYPESQFAKQVAEVATVTHSALSDPKSFAASRVEEAAKLAGELAASALNDRGTLHQDKAKAKQSSQEQTKQR